MKKAELIFIPLPTVGHLISTLEFAKHLIDRDDRIQITMLLMKLPVAPYADAYARSFAATQPRIQLVYLPELEEPPSAELLAKSVEAHIYALIEKNIPPAKDIITCILSSRRPDDVRVVGLVVDFFCVCMTDIAKEVSLPSYVFLPSNAGFLALMQYLPERHRKISSEFESNSDYELLILGLSNPVPPGVLPSGLFNKDGGYETYIKLARRFLDAKGIIVNTFMELEPYSVSHFLHGRSYPSVYSVGPVLELKSHPHPELDLRYCKEVMKWLDDQPESSVVFLCFGSMGSLRAPQVKEIACGLELSCYRFLWSLREDPTANEGSECPFPKGFLDRVTGRGMICGWAPQVEVLSHKAIGGFVSHCGWNSILESLWFGVPIMTWPMHAEQQLNAFRMVKELGLAVEMRLDYRVRGGEILMAEEIDRAVRCLMETGNPVRKKVKEMAVMARKAMTEGGSSFVAIERFIQDTIGNNL